MEEQIDEQKNEDDEEPIPQSQINEWIARKRVQDLMSAVIFFIWGLIINFLPGIYLNITIDWINILLQFLAMFLYIMSIVNLVRAYKNVLEKLDSETSSCIFFIVFIIMLQVFTQLATNPEARVMIVFAKIMVILCLLLVAAYSVLFVFRFFYYNPEKKREFIGMFTLKNITAAILGTIAVITTIIQFIQLILSLIPFKH